MTRRKGQKYTRRGPGAVRGGGGLREPGGGPGALTQRFIAHLIGTAGCPTITSLRRCRAFGAGGLDSVLVLSAEIFVS